MNSDHVNLMMLNMSFGALPPPILNAQPTCGLILGSGWSQALPDDAVTLRLGFDQIMGLGPNTVAGHAGEVRLLQIHGLSVIAFCGRRHWYEGEGWTPVVLPIELMRRLGVRDVLLTNAAGGIDPTLQPGGFLLIKDHINTVGLNPLQGPPIPGWGPRFPDQSQVYTPELRSLLLSAASEAGIPLTEGVYAYTAGPTYETPAEVRSYATMGAHAVGMSTVPEAIVASAAGLRVAAISCISNLAAGIGAPHLGHEEVLSETKRVTPQMTQLLNGFLKGLAARR